MAYVTGVAITAASIGQITGPLSVGGKVALGDAVSDSIGFYGVAKVAQRASASQASVSKLTTTTLTSPTAVAAKANAVLTLLNRLRADLVAIGWIGGAA